MPANSILPPFPSFFGADGKPLEGGYIYIGQAGFEARGTPKAAWLDAALTIPAGPYVRTMAGYPVANGTATAVYVDGNHSMTVTDKNGIVVFSALNRTFELGTPTSSVVPIVAPDGTLVQTGFGFISEPDTGLVRSATDTMQVVVSGTPVLSLTPTGIDVLQPMGGAGIAVRKLAQGALSGSELIVAIPSDIEAIEFTYWNYLPSTSGQALRLAIGSGTIGSPVWGANHLEQVQTVINTTYTPGSTAAAGFVFASFDQITGQPPGYGRIVANGFNVSGFVWGDTVRRGVVSGPLRATSHGSFAEETTVVHTLIRLFVSSGTMSGTYRLTGYRKP